MRKNWFIHALLMPVIFSILLSINLSAQGQAYFGQNMPGMQPVRFAPGIFTQELHAPPIFSPDGEEVFWNTMGSGDQHILFMKLENGVWTEPAVAPFCIGDYTDSPFITSNGEKLIFLTMNQPTYEESICIVEKLNGVWGTSQILGNEVNYIDPHWQASVADNQNLYFGGRSTPGDAGDIYFSEYVNGNYTTAVKLGHRINTDAGLEGSPFIAPDESYIIFDRVGQGGLYSDLYISMKQNDGGWSEASNLTELNTNGHDLYANVSPDGRFIIFLSSRTGLLLPYWVDAQIINNYVTDVDDTISDIPKDFQLSQNYPNPFNPETTIVYKIPSEANVSLKVYDIMGKEIATLVNDRKPAGTFEVTFNTTGLSSSVYFYRLTSNTFSQTKKMLVLK